jgi:hypothetical protein
MPSLPFSDNVEQNFIERKYRERLRSLPVSFLFVGRDQIVVDECVDRSLSNPYTTANLDHFKLFTTENPSSNRCGFNA